MIWIILIHNGDCVGCKLIKNESAKLKIRSLYFARNND